ncbi:hypothetical protein BN1723_006875 [Verticillium longisporum]|uniref:SCP domain-containing protein n=1 Tax=Verticillium longisporum TaxID=100787 RepID=A0A0G4NI88_VERLO|nr:hypothetical protein BN1708_004852 [Verticillium longisporum]CRK46096.1 hypothetical protein BN1723_006875 [Verticillium longisporum]
MKFPVPILSLLAVAQAVAIPSGSEASAFSFEQWVEDIIASPDGKHLSPEEAIDAHLAYINGTDVNLLESRALEKRVTCWTSSTSPPPAWTPSHVSITWPASEAGAALFYQYGQLFRRCGNARIYGTTGGSQSLPVTDICNVARAAGRVIDSCYRSDNTVRGSEMVSNKAYQLNLNGVN